MVLVQVIDAAKDAPLLVHQPGIKANQSLGPRAGEQGDARLRLVPTCNAIATAVPLGTDNRPATKTDTRRSQFQKRQSTPRIEILQVATGLE